MFLLPLISVFFFFNDTATTEIYTLSLHDALPIFSMMEEIKVMLRKVFITKNEMTFPVSGTGSAGMEFCFVNLIEPGDEVDRKSTRLNSSHLVISYAVFCLKKKNRQP